MQVLKSAIRKIYNIKVLTFIIINCMAHAQLPGSNAQPKSDDLVESSSFFKPAPVFSASYQAGSFIKIRGNYLTLDLLLPVYQKNQVLFLVDAGFQRFDDAKYASNLGLGVRVCKEQKMAGAHLFYDSLSASCRTHFHRLGASFEWFEERFDLHANGIFQRSHLPDIAENAYSIRSAAAIMPKSAPIWLPTPVLMFRLGRRY